MSIIDKALSVAKFIPGVATPASAISCIKNVCTGKFGAAALDLVGCIPFVGQAARVGSVAGKVALGATSGKAGLDIMTKFAPLAAKVGPKLPGFTKFASVAAPVATKALNSSAAPVYKIAEKAGTLLASKGLTITPAMGHITRTASAVNGFAA